jgi:Uma2 family endonuclease
MPPATLVSLEEYLHTEYEPDCDYVDGVLEGRNVGKKRHSRVQQKLILILSPVLQHLGLEVLPEQRLQVSPTRVRIPDVCVADVSSDEVIQTPPLLCIEVLSPDDRWNRIQRCLDDYLRFGVPVIWIVDPYEKEAWIVTQEQPKPAMVEELRWNDVVVPLSELLPEE